MPALPVIFALFRLLRDFIRALRSAWKDDTTRGLIYSVGLLLLLGTVFYHLVEGWNWLDSLYFTVITLTTVGYGDLSPDTPLGKIFTMIYLLMGLGLLASFISVIAIHYRGSDPDDETNTNNEGE